MIQEAPKVLTNCLAEVAARIQPLNNQVLVLDYTYCILENNQLKEIKSYYLHCIQEYEALLDEFIHENGNSIELTNGKNIEVLSCNSVNSRDCSGEMAYRVYDSKKTIDLKITNIESWHSFCRQKGLGGFLMTIFYQVSPNHRIGVYLILRDPLPESAKANEYRLELSDIIKDFLMTEGWSLTYEMVSETALLSILQSDVGFRKAEERELDTLRLYQNRVWHNGHTLFNILPDAVLGMDILQEKFKGKYPDDKELLEEFIAESKNLQLSLLVCRIIANKEIDELNGKSICGILTVLNDYETTKRVELDLSNGAGFDFIPSAYPEPKITIYKIFTVFWNLWNNAVKNAVTDSINIRAHGHRNTLQITFTNYGNELPLKNRLFLQHKNDEPVSQRGKSGGMYIIRNYLDELGWIVSLAQSKKISEGLYDNRIEISIPKPLL
ncbi:MAG: hypothetical protein HYU70_00610 [Bacteroidetes bacterium]|nr:hypothetical protein [Bacteroidota bacterium]